MEFSIATLLANFTDDKLVAPKILEKKLGCQDEIKARQLQIALDALEKIGILVKDKGRYRRVQDEELVEAKLRCSSKGFCFAIQDPEGAEDIYIRESNLSNAWNGDRVLVRVIKEGSRRRSPEGEVKLILERANPSVLARVKKGDSGYQAVPLDDRLLFELSLKANGIDLETAVEHLVHVEVVRYPLGATPPIGRVAQVLGMDAEDAKDLDIVCCKHDLPRSFTPAVAEATKGWPKQPRKNDLKGRLDLRGVTTIAFMSSPWSLSKTPDTKTIDRAFTLERLKSRSLNNPQWRVGVHISDVAYYVQPDTALDREARKRAICVYLGDVMLPMLPEGLSEDRCSLLPGVDRLAISILITVNSDGKVLEFEIQPSAIQVDHLLKFELVQSLIDASANDTPAPETSLEPAVLEMVQQIYQISKGLRKLRLDRGAVELNQPTNQYGICPSPFDDEGITGVTSTLTDQTARGMVCELTILANQLVASHLNALAVPGIYEVQSPPDPEEVEDIIKLAGQMGVELQLSNPLAILPQDFQAFTKQFATSPSERVLTYLLESSLKPPNYSIKASAHFGLALPAYTHCTAPLRRYADLLVQRLLHLLFEQGRDRKSTRAKERINLHHSNSHGQITWNVLAPDLQHEIETELAAIVYQITDREKSIQEAEEDLQGLKKAALMKERIGEIFQGLITGVQSYGFFVEIEVAAKSGEILRLEGLVHVSSLKDDWYEYRSRQQTLVGRKNRKQYRLGDKVEVQVKSVDYYRQQIDLVAIGGGSQATNSDYDMEPEEYNPYDPYEDE
ncbi:MAG TPA: VacB/RNase II family 3'-5' exoribonuclease [Oscillatoriaceae cyanobacterium M33_DOE_052]|uniref:RNB domain-containing ribonuclease n=1 Tax=Planktothricoides sp. SpSt-374 TaxID=2282167 RepID=A0A7C3ZWN3_9CYAN|nr:VacB/RNase II family 3'-5' exoribonuclease [Oscillatoriaceae cyanobacterium M33_DOE_052]